MFVDHSTANTAYPADLYCMIIREDLADFEARWARLTRKQRAVLVGVLPRTLADVIRAGLASTS